MPREKLGIAQPLDVADDRSPDEPKARDQCPIGRQPLVAPVDRRRDAPETTSGQDDLDCQVGHEVSEPRRGPPVAGDAIDGAVADDVPERRLTDRPERRPRVRKTMT